MNQILAIFSALLKNWVRSKSGVFFSFLFPVMLLLIFGTVFGGTESVRYRLYVQNFDFENGEPTDLSRAFINALNSTGAFEITELSPTLNVTAYVEENPSFSSYRILIIPKDFQRSTINRSIAAKISVATGLLGYVAERYSKDMNETMINELKTGWIALNQWKSSLETGKNNLLLLIDEGDTAAPVIKGIIYSVVNAFNNRLIGTEEVVSVESKSIVERKLKAADYYLPGYIAAFIMTNGVIGATSTISEYRRNGIVKRLAATPLSKASWIMGNILQQAVLAFMLTAIMIGLGWIVFHVRVHLDVCALLLIFTGAVAFSCVGMVLGGIIRDVEAASGAGNAIAFPMMFLSGAFWPIEMMPAYLQAIAKLLPLYYFHEGLRDIMIHKSPGSAAQAFLVLAVFAIVFLFLAIKITKWKEL